MQDMLNTQRMDDTMDDAPIVPGTTVAASRPMPHFLAAMAAQHAPAQGTPAAQEEGMLDAFDAPVAAAAATRPMPQFLLPMAAQGSAQGLLGSPLPVAHQQPGPATGPQAMAGLALGAPGIVAGAPVLPQMPAFVRATMQPNGPGMGPQAMVGLEQGAVGAAAAAAAPP